jgi:hypothetical protein
VSACAASRTRALLGRVASDDLVEIAPLSAGSLVLHDQCQVIVVEFLEPLVPRDLFERISAAVARKIEANHSDVIAASSVADACRPCAAFFGPASDFVVIGKGL